MRTLLQVVVLVTPLLSVDAAVAAELPVAGPLPHAFTASVGARVVLVGGGGMGGHNSGGMGSSQTGGMNGGASASSGQVGGMSGAQTGGMNGGTTANSRPPGGTSDSRAEPAQSSTCATVWARLLQPFHQVRCAPGKPVRLKTAASKQ